MVHHPATQGILYDPLIMVLSLVDLIVALDELMYTYIHVHTQDYCQSILMASVSMIYSMTMVHIINSNITTFI